MKQKYISVLLVGFLFASAGCLGIASSEAPVATVEEGVVQNTSYEEANQTSQSYNQTVGIAGVEQEFEIENKVTVYEKNNTADGGPIPSSVYGVLSTPSVSIAGSEINPIVSDPTERAKDDARNQSFGSVEIGEKTDTINTTHKPTEQNITIEEYDGRIIVDEVSAFYSAKVYTTVVETDNSVMVVSAAYPVAAKGVEDNRVGNTTEEEVIVEMIRNTTTKSEEGT